MNINLPHVVRSKATDEAVAAFGIYADAMYYAQALEAREGPHGPGYWIDTNW